MGDGRRAVGREVMGAGWWVVEDLLCRAGGGITKCGRG
jgi:hypothetical protein